MTLVEEGVLFRVNEVLPLPDVGFKVALLNYTFRDLGWTNVDLAELVVNLEEAFEVTFENDKFINVESEDTLEDLVIYVELLKGV